MYFGTPREERKALATRYAFMQEMSNQLLENYALILALVEFFYFQKILKHFANKMGFVDGMKDAFQ